MTGRRPGAPVEHHLKSYVCIHVFTGERPVVLVNRSCGDWSLVCGDEHEDDAAAYRVVGIGHVIDRDPTFLAVADLPPNWEAERRSVGADWARRELAPDERV